MNKYRKKPIIIDAVQWMGNNISEIECFVDSDNLRWSPSFDLFIRTLEGELFATIGDYIIRGVRGEFYPCKSDIFEETYEIVE